MTPSNPEPGAEKALGVRIAGQRPRVEVGKDPSGQGKSDLSSPDTSRDYISHDLRDIYPSTGLPTLRHPHEAPERGQQQGHFAEKVCASFSMFLSLRAPTAVSPI